MKELVIALFSLSICTGALADRRENLRILESYMAALNRHDVEGQYAHYSADMFYVDEGRRGVMNKEGSRLNRQFESANNARWSYRLLGSGADTLELLITEEMDYYNLLGSGPRTHRATYRFREGKIVETRAWDWTQRGRPYAEARDSFVRWATRERPAAAAEIMRDGRLLFNAETAPAINRLVREWRSAVNCRLYHPAPNAASTHIVFSSDCAPPWGIYLVNADGSMPRRITPQDMDARFPNWSPDGQRIAFHSNREGSWDVYLINVDGSGLVRLTSTAAAETSPAFSPDGKQILYTSDADGLNDLFVMPAAGGQPIRLTRGAATGFRTIWAPDGGHVLYRSNGSNDMSLPGQFYRVRLDGTPAGVVGGGKRREYNQSYSPDGTRIAFDAHRTGQWESSDGGWEIWVMKADGGGRKRLTRNQVNDWGPAWFPDGKRIVFLSGSNNVYDLYTMNADGSHVRRLTYWTSLEGSR